MPKKTLTPADLTRLPKPGPETVTHVGANLTVSRDVPNILWFSVDLIGAITMADVAPILRDWIAASSDLTTLREPARRLAQATDDLSAAVAGVSSAGLPPTRKRDRMTVTDDIATVIAEMTEASTEMESAVAYIDSVPGLIATAVEDAMANGATAAEIAPVTSLGTTLAARSAALKAALAPPTTP